jgi:hypothetical protein
MVGLAVFLGIQNASAGIQGLIVEECNAALTTSPFTDVSVTQLRDACSQDNADYLRRTVMWTGIRAGIQVPFISPPPTPQSILSDNSSCVAFLVSGLFIIGSLFLGDWILDNLSIHQTLPTK